MASQQQPAAPDFWQTDEQQHKQLYSALSTAQILTEFQHNDPQRTAASACSESCKSQPEGDCFAECELPFTPECTDSCVVVCEEAHSTDTGELCCEPTTVCQSSDCQYSSLDHGCCMGCPDGHNLEENTSDNFFQDPYETNQSFGNLYHTDVPNYNASHTDSNFDTHGCNAWHSACQSSLSFSHCSQPCSVGTFGPYNLTPTSTMTHSTADSPWSFQSSPVVSTHGSQSSSGNWIDSNNYKLSVLAASISDDYRAFESMQAPSAYMDAMNPTGSSQLYDINNDFGVVVPKPTKSTQKHRSRTSNPLAPHNPTQRKRNTVNIKSEPIDAMSELQCRWVVSGNDSHELCLCKFDSREDLHTHILDAHIKSLKRRSSPSSLYQPPTEHPICRWHGCESAHRKKVFKLQHLKDHIVCHSKLRMKCSLCGKECRDAKVLKIHMNSHRPGQEKPFKCDFDGCSASFGTSALLSSHKRVHTGEKPHKCAYCDYRAADKGNLRRHEEEMHMGKKWPCPYCSQQLAKKANLTRHIRDLHAEQHARRQEETGLQQAV